MNRRLRFSARIAAGAATVVGLAALVTAAMVIDVPVYRADAAPVTVTPEAANQVRVCPGSLLEVGQDASAATALTPLGTPERVASGTGDIEHSRLGAPDIGADADGPPVVTLPAAGQAGMMGASQSQQVGTETVAGFAAAECQETDSDLWFVAGSTDVGRTSVLLLNNPSGVDASVDVEVTGENGAVESPNGLDLLVEAGTQKVVDLAAIAPNTITPVVHVTSSGADIQAWVQQSSIRGLIPSGVEMAGHSAPPSDEATIPGVQISPDQPTIETQEYDDRRPSVRMYAPSGDATHVTMTVTDASGEDVSTNGVDIPAGTVGEYPLSGVDPGTYSIHLDATSPVVAAARTSVAEDKSGDFAWFASATELDAPFIVDGASGPNRTLLLQNPGATEATVAVGDSEVTIPPGAIASRELDGAVTVDPGAPVTASVAYAGAGAVSSFVITPPKPASEPVDVYVR